MIDKKENCCGCGSCYQICPQNCIELQYDGEGFLYPSINYEKCLNCGLCENSCPVNKSSSYSECSSKVELYAAINKDEKIRMNSSSGGIFTLFAEWILDHGGLIFGAAFDDDWTVHHVAIESRNELFKLRSSKYMQSRTERTYSEVKQKLLENRLVLYTGTPCEIEGLKKYLKNDYENLYTQDIICHGSPSPKLWKKYVEYRERRANADLRELSFRHKKVGRSTYSVQFEFANNTKYEKLAAKDIYTQMFLQNLCLRPSCYNCSFKKINRVSDITLGDFWGCDEFCPELDDGKGCSIVIVHSEKGRKLFDAIKSKIKYEEIDELEAFTYNPSMTMSASMPKLRDEFMAQIDTISIDELANKYLKHPTLKSRISEVIPKKLKKKIKALISNKI